LGILGIHQDETQVAAQTFGKGAGFPERDQLSGRESPGRWDPAGFFMAAVASGKSLSGWWFGTFFNDFPIILGMECHGIIIPTDELTNSMIFQMGLVETTKQYIF
jgi:hypothetical protein